VAQHTLDQTPFVPPGSRRAGLWQFRHVAPKLRTECKRNETKPRLSTHLTRSATPTPVAAISCIGPGGIVFTAPQLHQ
jgi:hypothetical protein